MSQSHYLILPRRFRPRTFAEVLGQEVVVTILTNAIKQKRIGQAYLFCGARGTGKTTLARLFAKALNCLAPSPSGEPCNACSFCREIDASASLDVLEIDGASHRGIDDIRQINETVGYAAASGKYKIYIIDEVHMLTKEAFNALLKTLEEPPPKVKFFFATTEPHKIPGTIASRCQCFTLNRISQQLIVRKLQYIATSINLQISDEALYLIASHADGALRDAESLLDQIIAFHNGYIGEKEAAHALGIAPREMFFILDHAGATNDLAQAFTIAEQLFSQGKDIVHFVDDLTNHFRNLSLIKISPEESPLPSLPSSECERYRSSAKLYTREQCLYILDLLIEAQAQIRLAPSSQVALEALLLRILRSHHRIAVEQLVQRLVALEKQLTAPPAFTGDKSTALVEQPSPAPHAISSPTVPREERKPSPTPSESTARFDTLLQFAAVELEGKIEKNRPAT